MRDATRCRRIRRRSGAPAVCFRLPIPVCSSQCASSCTHMSMAKQLTTQPCGAENDSPFTERAGRNPVEDYQADSAALQEFGSYLMASLPKFIQQTSVYKDELTLYVAPAAVVPVCHFLRDHTNTQYKTVVDICGVDYPTRSKRFEVVYHLLSVKHNSRIRVKTYADEVSPVPSVTGLFNGADWCALLSPGPENCMP